MSILPFKTCEIILKIRVKKECGPKWGYNNCLIRFFSYCDWSMGKNPGFLEYTQILVVSESDKNDECSAV